ncbi:alkaline phosphatase family protein [bacterium]|nr:alkaline phosphatase family protein [bacterium]
MASQFSLTLSLLLSALLLGSCAQKPTSNGEDLSIPKEGLFSRMYEPGSFPVMQGPTSAKETVLVVLRPSSQKLKYKVQGFEQRGSKKKPNQWREPKTKTHSFKFHKEMSLDEVSIVNKGEGPVLSFHILDRKGQKLDTRTFSFLDPDKKSLKFVVASCMDDRLVDVQKEMWGRVKDQDPEALFLIGDNVYADAGVGDPSKITMKELERRYIETRQSLDLFRHKKLIPVFSTWDDHDFGQNNGGSDFKLKNEVSQLFLKFFPVRNYKDFSSSGPGVSSWIQMKSLDLFLLDDRSFRTKDLHFGKKQEDWVLKNLNPEKLTLLVSGDQWFGGYHSFESFEGNHKENFESFLARIKEKKAKVFFVSGDRHLTEIIKVPPSLLGQTTFELTSSGIHANMYPGAFKRDPNPNQLVGVDGKLNFAVIELKNEMARQRTIKVRSLGQGKKTLFKRTLKLKP